LTLLLVYVATALVVSFVCSILEAVLLSITPSYLAVLDNEKHRTAGRMRALKEEIDRPLAAILSLNTIAHTVGAAGAGAQAAKVFGEAKVGIFSAALTFIILIATEIVPKTLGATHWKRLAPLVTRVVRFLMIVMWPLVKLAEWITKLLAPKDPEPIVSRDEISALADAATNEGVVEAGESRLVRSLLRFAMLRVCDVMTPVEHVVTLNEESLVGEDREPPPLPFSRIPLCRKTAHGEEYTGYILKTDVLQHAAESAPVTSVIEKRRDLIFISDTMPLPEIFDCMVERREHIAMARNDKGEPTGLVTMEDIIETLLGLEIFDEVDDAERIQRAARNYWHERARRLGRISDATGGTASLGITGAASHTHKPAGVNQSAAASR